MSGEKVYNLFCLSEKHSTVMEINMVTVAEALNADNFHISFSILSALGDVGPIDVDPCV